MKKITIDLDVVDLENDDLKALTKRSRKGGVKLIVHTLNGPGGGNPFVAVTGSRYALLGWLLTEYTLDKTEAELMLDPDSGYNTP